LHFLSYYSSFYLSLCVGYQHSIPPPLSPAVPNPKPDAKPNIQSDTNPDLKL